MENGAAERGASQAQPKEADPNTATHVVAEGRAEKLITSASSAPWLRRPEAIRSRCSAILAAGTHGDLRNFEVREESLPVCARFVAEVIRSAYPDLDVPHYSRWRQFSAGGVERWGDLCSKTAASDSMEIARHATALTVLSTLMDAGAGYGWKYREAETGHRYERSEGVAVATFRMFEAGILSQQNEDPFGGHQTALEDLTAETLASAFQVTPDNPLVGLKGRLELLHALGALMADRTDIFSSDNPELGHLADYLVGLSSDGVLQAVDILEVALEVFAPLWSGGATLNGDPLGDVWRHEAAGGAGPTEGLVPLHALGQWMVYSLVDPLKMAGVTVTELQALSGRAEHSNGGLLVDTGVLQPKHPAVAIGIHPVNSPVSVEWRALTIALLDPLADLVRGELGVGEDELPFSSILEGGTIRAGRIIAQARRDDGGAPVRVASDGVIF